MIIRIARDFGALTGNNPNDLTVATLVVALVGLVGLGCSDWLIRRYVKLNDPAWLDRESVA